MKAIQRILLTIGIVVVLLAGFFLVTEAITKYTGFSITPETDNSDLKNCLKEKEISLYTNTYDLAETLKELKTIDNLDGVEIVNCLRSKQDCSDKEIDSFPMWIINDNIVYGDITVDELTELSGCIFADNK